MFLDFENERFFVNEGAISAFGVDVIGNESLGTFQELSNKNTDLATKLVLIDNGQGLDIMGLCSSLLSDNFSAYMYSGELRDLMDSSNRKLCIISRVARKLEMAQNAQNDVENIAEVILVGSGSHILKLRSLTLKLCEGKAVYEEAAVYGAAIGVRADGTNVIPIVQRNATIPARKDAYFTTSYDNQCGALIIVYEAEGKKVKENHLLGFFKLSRIPSATGGVPLINVCTDVDAFKYAESFCWCDNARVQDRVKREARIHQSFSW